MKTFSKAKPLASRIGICAKTLFRWADAGLISRHPINARVVLFDVEEVLAFVEGAKVSAPVVTRFPQSPKYRTETGQTETNKKANAG